MSKRLGRAHGHEILLTLRSKMPKPPVILSQIILGLLAYLLSALSFAWVLFYLFAIGAAGAGGNTPPFATISIYVFPLPVLALAIDWFTLRSWRKQEKTRRLVWLLAPAAALVLAALVMVFVLKP
jgi:hypothetical protein